MRLIAASLAAVAAALVVARAVGVLPDSIGRFQARVRNESSTELALRQAGLAMSVSRFRAGSLACGALAFVAVYGLSGIGVVAIVPALFACGVPHWWMARRAAGRQDAIQQAWPDAIRDVVASISAGLSLQHALENLATTGPVALRPAFTQFSVTSRAVGVSAALESVRDDLADATSDRVVEVLLVAHERGGAIVPEILRDLTSATSRDIWLLEQVRTESLEQRINATAVFALPWLVLIAVTLQDGPFRDFYRSGMGIAVIGVGGLASAFGMALVRRLASQPQEPRVLGVGS